MTALIIVLCIFLLISVLLFIPLYFTFDSTKDDKIELRYGLIKIKLKKKYDNESEEKPKKKKNLKKSLKKYGNTEVLGKISDLIKKIFEKLKRFKRHLLFKDFCLTLIAGGENASKTAVLYGSLCSLVYPFYSLFSETFRFEKQNLELKADFDNKQTVCLFFTKIRIAPFFVLCLLISAAPVFINFYKGVVKDDE